MFKIRANIIIPIALLAVTIASFSAIPGAAQTKITLNPSNVTLMTNGRQQFVAQTSVSISASLVWSVAGIRGGNSQVGTISSTGLYTAPSSPVQGGTVISATNSTGSVVTTAAVVTLVDASTVTAAHEHWLAGVEEAAARHGCKNIIEQQATETVAEAIQFFRATATEGTCLVLQPISNSAESGRYSIASGGNIDGLNLLYISDVSRIRIWNGVPVNGD